MHHSVGKSSMADRNWPEMRTSWYFRWTAVRRSSRRGRRCAVYLVALLSLMLVAAHQIIGWNQLSTTLKAIYTDLAIEDGEYYDDDVGGDNNAVESGNSGQSAAAAEGSFTYEEIVEKLSDRTSTTTVGSKPEVVVEDQLVVFNGNETTRVSRAKVVKIGMRKKDKEYQRKQLANKVDGVIADDPNIPIMEADKLVWKFVPTPTSNKYSSSLCTDEMCRLFHGILLQKLNISDSNIDSLAEKTNETPQVVATGDRDSTARDMDRDGLCDDDCRALQRHFVKWPSGKPRAAIYYYLRWSSSIATLRRSIISVNRHFNSKYRYPFVVFLPPWADGADERNAIRDIAKKSPSSIQLYIQSTDFYSNSTVYRSHRRLRATRRNSISGRKSHHLLRSAGGHRQKDNAEACRFQTGLVYQHPVFKMSGIEYVMRVGDDVALYVRVQSDLFRKMKSKQIHYAYTQAKTLSSVGVMQNENQLIEAVGIFVNASKSSMGGGEGDFVESFVRWRQHPVRYATKIELSAISVWTSSLYQNYFSFVDSLGGMQQAKWSESTIKSIGVALFVSRKHVRRVAVTYTQITSASPKKRSN